MNKIIRLEKVQDYEKYNPVLILSEDLDYDNLFCILNTSVGNIAFSYYDLGIAPDYILQDTILFLCFGKSYYIVNLKEKNILYHSNGGFSAFFEIVKFDMQSCIVFIGEMSLICFNLVGEQIWENNYRNTIFDWSIMDEGILVVFENNAKWLVLLKNGNGVPVV